MDCSIREAKTKALTSFTVTAKLICVFIFAYAKSRFSHDEAQILVISHSCVNGRSSDCEVPSNCL